MTQATHENLTDYYQARGPSDRAFGLVFAGFFLVAAGLPALRGGGIRLWALAVSALFAACGLLWPAGLSGMNRAWMRLARLLGRATNPMVLGALFYLVFTPVGVCRRLFGGDPLRLRFDPEASSYWIPRESPPSPMDLQF